MTAATQPFGARLTAAFQNYGQVCVGIDPHPGMLTDWGLSDDAAGLREFGSRVIEAAAGRVGVVKPQVGFFESYGIAGMQALAEIIAEAKAAGLLVIADAKRGDIGSTMVGYAEGWLNPDKDFGADALTVSPFLGFGSLAPAVEAAERFNAGLFILALTSNPEGQEIQLAQQQHQVAGAAGSRRSVAGHIAAQTARINRSTGSPGGTADPALGNVGLVVGATTASLAARHRIDLTSGRPPLLAPGFGAQGADLAEVRAGFGSAWPQVLASSSRAILNAGPKVSELIAAVEAFRTEIQ